MSESHSTSKEEAPLTRNLEIFRLAGVGLVAVLVAWLRLVQPDWLADAIVLATIILGGYPLYRNSLTALRGRNINMELSMVIAIIASLVSTQFLAATVITFSALFSEYLEELIVQKGRKSIQALYDLAPRKALVRNEHGEIVRIEVENVKIGDRVIVREGDTIPVDGTIMDGSSTVDQSSMIGESIPTEKDIGDTVLAGTVNLTRRLEIRAEKPFADTNLAKLVLLIGAAEQSKAPVQKLSDRLSTRLIQSAIIFSAITYLLTRNIISTVSVVVVAGACGVAVGTPIAIIATIGKLSRRGVIVKGGVQVEKLKRVSTIVFDKTGTLTYGNPTASRVITFDPDISSRTVLEYAAVAEWNVNHPLAKAVEERAQNEGIRLDTITTSTSDDQIVAGSGVVRVHNGDRICVGNMRFMQQELSDGTKSTSVTGQLQSQLVQISQSIRNAIPGLDTILGTRDPSLLDSMTAFVSVNRRIIGAICFEDQLRKDAKETISRLKSMGIHVIMLTGDNEGIARKIAAEAGIDGYYAQLLPQDKVSRIEEIVAKQKKGKSVVMVGDGINDAPALAKADVGIAMGRTGTDLAVETADVVLMREDLLQIPRLIESSRKALSAIQQNFLGTLGVDGFGFILAFIGSLNPLVATLIHVGSELVFVSNSGRLVIDKEIGQ